MNFDRFLAALFSKATAFIIGIIALLSSFVGINAANAQGTVQCTENDCLSCIMCGCLTPETTCDMLDCFRIRVCGGCKDAAGEAACSAAICTSDCVSSFQDCLYDAGCNISCADSACVDCLDENCTDENGNPACNGKTTCICTDEDGNPTCVSPDEEEDKVSLSDLTYGEIIRDYFRLLSFDEFVDIAEIYYGEYHDYEDYVKYSNEYEKYNGSEK